MTSPLYRPSYDNTNRCCRVVRVRDGVEHTLLARFPDAQAALRAIERLEELHGLTTAPVTTEEQDETFYRQVALAGEWDDEGAVI